MRKLAQVAGVSVRRLERLFAAHLRETVGECYLRIRLEKAAELPRKTRLSVTAIGLACGFQSSSHFARSDKSRYGLALSSGRTRAALQPRELVRSAASHQADKIRRRPGILSIL
jgi:transcriptional regulator GlxA family with amidase domain